MSKTVPLYQEVARRLEEIIASGVYEPGERLPSIREIHREFRVSINTTREANRLLEDQGIVDPRSRSGHFVRWLPPLCDDCSMNFLDPTGRSPTSCCLGQRFCGKRPPSVYSRGAYRFPQTRSSLTPKLAGGAMPDHQ